MSNLWIRWTENHPSLIDALGVDDYATLKQVVADALENDNTGRSLVRKLIAGVPTNGLSTQILTNWYQFSPFIPDDYLSDLLLLAPTQEQLDSYNQMRTLESEIATLREQIADLDDIKNKHSSHWNNIVGLHAAQEKLESQLTEQQTSFQQLTTYLDDIMSRVNSVAHKLRQFGFTHEEVFEKLSLIESRTLTEQQLATVQHIVSVWDEQQGKQEQSITEIQSALSRLEAVKNEMAERGSVEHREILENKPAPEILPRPIQSTWKEQYELLEEQDTVVGHVQKNLTRLGIRTQHSKKLALEIISALASGQMVTFEGSFAELTTEYCAISLAGDAVYKVKIPIGLNRDEQIESAIDNVLNILETRKFPIAVIFEGLNRSALDAFGSSIKELVVKRLIGLKGRNLFAVLLFATVGNGVTNIPYGRELFELGPIFHTDSLGWKNKRSVSAVIPGMVVLDTWMALTDLPDTLLDLDDTEVPDWVYHKGGALWAKQFVTTFQMYNKLVKDENTLKTVSSLSFGWIFPMLITTDPSATRELLAELDLDDRVDSLLRSRVGVTI